MVRRLAGSVEWRRLGFWVWVVRRVSGHAVALYLLLHIVVIHQLVAGQTTFNEAMSLFATPAFRLGELAVVVACVLHAADGLRVMVIDAFDLARAQRPLLVASVAVAGLVIVVGGAPLLFHALGIGGLVP